MGGHKAVGLLNPLTGKDPVSFGNNGLRGLTDVLTEGIDKLIPRRALPERNIPGQFLSLGRVNAALKCQFFHSVPSFAEPLA